MKYLEFEDFEFIINVFNTYPQPLTIEFFIKNEHDKSFLLGTLKATLKNIRQFCQTDFKDYYFISENGVKISVIQRDSLDCRRHIRGNLIICDYSYPWNIIEECYKPLCNLKPNIGIRLWYNHFPEEYCKRVIENENKKSN